MINEVEKVTDMDKANALFTDKIISKDKENVISQTQARIKKINELKNNKNEKIKPIPVYNNKTFMESFSSITKTMILPKDEEVKSRFFKNESKITTIELLLFYFYRSILTIFYLIFSIYRLYEYSVNKIKIKFLNMAYKSNDDATIINSDINKLNKIPQKLSVILNYKSEQEEGGGIEGLCNDGSSVAAWCVSSGISNISIYEVNGILKKSIPQFSRSIFKTFESYFGTDNVPRFLIKIPHLNLSYSGIDGLLIDNNKNNNTSKELEDYHIEISLLSRVDGRSTIVELTKVMAQLAKDGELKKSDVTVNFLDRELKQLIGEEPDLIILFQPYLDLQGYPPWHIRLSEMYWEPDNDNVSYVVFLRALQKFSTCKSNMGK